MLSSVNEQFTGTKSGAKKKCLKDQYFLGKIKKSLHIFATPKRFINRIRREQSSVPKALRFFSGDQNLIKLKDRFCKLPQVSS